MADNPGEVRFLDDVRVLEVSNLAPNQLAMHLADLGAEVIKIEPPERGDATRLIDMRGGGGDSFLHRRWNRGKKSVALDMRAPDGLDLFRRLVAEVDILIEGLRPGNIERMGLDWADLTALNPKLVMIALSGFGQVSPYRDKPSHGMGFDAVTGTAMLDEDGQGRPMVPLELHVNIGTNMGPLFGAMSALAALSWARRNQKPVFLDVALADAAAFANLELEGFASERSIAEHGVTSAPSMITAQHGDGPRQRSATLQYYRAGDGKILLVMPLERKFMVKLIELLDRPDLLQHFSEDHVRGPRHRRGVRSARRDVRDARSGRVDATPRRRRHPGHAGQPGEGDPRRPAHRRTRRVAGRRPGHGDDEDAGAQ
jgi:crotonobetainyl-CoA:carnitine CoA-transferase CaiB-like acyl-CoA transferase